MPYALTLSFSRRAVLTDFRKALRCVPPAVLQGVMAAAVLCALAPGAINAMQDAQVGVGMKAASASSPEASAAGVRTRCAGCGFVESIRHVEAAGLVPAAYEFTVRMRDGSVQTSTDSSAGKWLAGDRIILVGGTKATAQEPH
jgi:hypothetical protein